MRNASLATRGERAATLHRRAVSPLSCTSPLSHLPLSLPLRRLSFVLLFLLLALSFSRSFFSPLLFLSTRGSSFARSLAPQPTSSDRLLVLLFIPTFEYVCTSAAVLFVLSFDLPQSPSSAILLRLLLSLSLSSSFTLSLSLSVSCSSLSVTSLSLSLSHTISRYSPLRFGVDIHPELFPPSLFSSCSLSLSLSFSLTLYFLRSPFTYAETWFFSSLSISLHRGRLLANRACDNTHACAIDVLIGRLF